MTRMMLYTFHGPNRTGDAERGHLAEAPWVMTAPLIVLGALSLAGGWFNYPAFLHDLLPAGPRAVLERWLDPVVGEPAGVVSSTEYLLVGAAVAIGVVGILVAVSRLKPERLVPKARAPEERGF